MNKISSTNFVMRINCLIPKLDENESRKEKKKKKKVEKEMEKATVPPLQYSCLENPMDEGAW